MTKIKVAIVLLGASLLYTAPIFSHIQGLSNIVQAAENAEVDKPKRSKKVPAMRNRVYTQLARAQKLADEGDKLSGFEVLDDVKDSISSLNSYERAMLWNFYGFMYYGNDDLGLAIDSFEQVIKEESIPESLYLSTLYSLAQLAMQQQDYDKTLAYLQQWQAANDKPLNEGQQILFAQVYYQNKQFELAVTHIEQAIALATDKNQLPKENWLVLQRASYYELKQPEKVTKVMEQLVRLYSKGEYWLQLSGMYGEIGEEAKQLAVMEAAWQAGYITKSTDIIILVQLYRYHDVPYKAAKLLEEAISSGAVTAEEKYLAMLAQAYIAAKNDEKSIPVLIRAANISENGKFDAQLAQAYLNLEKWTLAIKSADKALSRGITDEIGTMHLVIGMSNFNLKKYDLSLIALSQAQKFDSVKKTAQQWFHYVEREQGHQESLALLR